MLNALIGLLPIFFFGFIGWFLRFKEIVNPWTHTKLLRFGFFVLAPFVVFHAMASAQWTDSFIAFPIFALFAGIGGYIAGRVAISKKEFSTLKKPIVVMSAMFINTPFALTFLMAQYRTEANSRVVVFNVLNLILVYGFGHWLAARANPEASQERPVHLKLIRSTPLWGLILGFVANILSWDIPSGVDKFANTASLFVAGFSALAIGMCLTFSKQHLSDSLFAIAIRYSTAILVATAIVLFFDLEGLDRAVILTLGVAPVGFSTLTFANLEKLDEGFAANTLSISFAVSALLSTVVLVTLG